MSALRNVKYICRGRGRGGVGTERWQCHRDMLAPVDLFPPKLFYVHNFILLWLLTCLVSEINTHFFQIQIQTMFITCLMLYEITKLQKKLEFIPAAPLTLQIKHLGKQSVPKPSSQTEATWVVRRRHDRHQSNCHSEMFSCSNSISLGAWFLMYYFFLPGHSSIKGLYPPLLKILVY